MGYSELQEVFMHIFKMRINWVFDFSFHQTWTTLGIIHA